MKDIRRIYYMHPSLDCLFVAKPNCYVIDQFYSAYDDNRFYKGYKRKLYLDFLNKFWFEKELIRVKYISNDSKSKKHLSIKQFRSIIKDGNNSLDLYQLPFSLEEQKHYENFFYAKLYNSRLQSDKIYSAFTFLFSKANMINYIQNRIPDIINPDMKIVCVEDLEKELYSELSLREKPFVVKAEFSQGGIGSRIISTKKDIKIYLKYLKSNIVNKLVRSKKFIIEEFISYSNLPSICYFIYDDKIEQIYIQDRIVENLYYRSSFFPSKSRFIKSIRKCSFELAQSLHEMGYRGPADFEFIENKKKIYFCEVNSRYPISIYPFFYDLDFTKPICQIYIKLFEGVLSYEYLNDRLNKYWFDQKEKKGVLPMGIPDFFDFKNNFRLLVAGYNDFSDIKKLILKAFPDSKIYLNQVLEY